MRRRQHSVFVNRGVVYHSMTPRRIVSVRERCAPVNALGLVMFWQRSRLRLLERGVRLADLTLEVAMGVLLILAVVVSVAVGVGFTTWQLSRQDAGRYSWVVDGAGDLSELEKGLNHFSEEGFGIHRIISTHLEPQQPAFVIVGRRPAHSAQEPIWLQTLNRI